MKPKGAYLLEEVYRRDYLINKDNFFKVWKIHRYGYSWDDWHVSNITKDNFKDYLRTVDYYAIHPINDLYSQWIDDKPTLKYLCVGTELDKYMPKYYYQIDQNGKVLALPDIRRNNSKNLKIEDIVEFLEKINELAFNLCLDH